MQGISDTIVAVATPPGKGGIGIVRVSGPDVRTIAQAVLHKLPQPRYAEYLSFYDERDQIVDEGIALFFPKPHSFTGEDVLELHGHGGPIVLDSLVSRILRLGARLARPGEFSERAFLNDKIDLVQAEAIADLIDATSEQAARSAVRSLQGEFSRQIQQLQEAMIHLRLYVEAAIDFPDEEINFLADEKVAQELVELIRKVEHTLEVSEQGTLLREGMTVAIAGKPNAGKSSLLNQLSGREVAIVTEIPGTTRDILREYIHIKGMPIHVMDTAGLRESPDLVEQEGIRRAKQAIEQADRVLLVIDVREVEQLDLAYLWPIEQALLPPPEKVTVICNKIDMIEAQKPQLIRHNDLTIIYLSAKTGEGIELLRQHLADCVGYTRTPEGLFSARRRHIEALWKALDYLRHGYTQLTSYQAGELLAEDLRLAHAALGEITGEFTADDLLGRIFASFCIGK